MKQHALLQQYCDTLLTTKTNSLVVNGPGGIGKSWTVLKKLEALGLEEGVHYVYISGHVTPLQLYNIIYGSATLEAPQLLVFDDVDSIVKNKTSVALLKACLWEVRGKRIVSYQSTSSKVEGDMTCEFNGKVIMILNDIKQEEAFGSPLLDRGILYNMKLSTAEIIEYVNETIDNIPSDLPVEQRKEVWAKVIRFADNPSFSMRSLTRAFDFRKSHPEIWMTLYVNTLKLTREQRILYEVREKNLPTDKARAQTFAKLTGLSERTYQRVKKTLND